MRNAKNGLRLICLSIIVSLMWAIISVIVPLVNNTSDFTKNMATITSGVSIGCGALELFGLFIAGRDNAYFRASAKLKVSAILLVFVSFMLSISKHLLAGNEFVVKILSISLLSVSFVSLLIDVIVLNYILKGCRQISPRVRKLSIFVELCFVVSIIAEGLTGILNIVAPTSKFLTALAIILLISLLVFSVFYVILIFRTTKNVRKPRK